MYMVTPATEASKMAVSHLSKILDLGKNGLQLTDDFVMRLKSEFASNDPNAIVPCVPFQDDDMERPVEMCLFETYLLHNLNMNDKVIIIADTRHTQRWSERGVGPMLCNGDLAFFSDSATTLEGSRLWAHERTPGIQRNVEDLEAVEFADVLGAIAEDQHLTRCAQVCFTCAEENQAEHHDEGTIDEVLGDQDLDKEKMSWKKLPEKLICFNRYLLCRCNVLPEHHKIISMQQRHFDGAVTTQSQDLRHTKYHHLDLTRSKSRSGSRCVRDR